MPECGSQVVQNIVTVAFPSPNLRNALEFGRAALPFCTVLGSVGGQQNKKWFSIFYFICFVPPRDPGMCKIAAGGAVSLQHRTWEGLNQKPHNVRTAEAEVQFALCL